MRWALLSFVFVLIVSMQASLGQMIFQKSFEFENVVSEGNGLWVWREAASGFKTLHIVDRSGLSQVSLTLCLKALVPKQNVLVMIDNIRYINDGPSDQVRITLDDVPVANWTTIGRLGDGIKLKESGSLGAALYLPTGYHNLTINLETDEEGVELDKIDMTFENQNPDYDVICGTNLYIPQ